MVEPVGMYICNNATACLKQRFDSGIQTITETNAVCVVLIVTEKGHDNTVIYVKKTDIYV